MANQVKDRLASNLEKLLFIARSEGSIDSTGGDSPLTATQPPALESPKDVSVNAALSLGAVYRSIDILCTSVSQLDIGVWRGDNELKSIPSIVARPDVNTSASSFYKKTVMSLASTGNAYWRLYREDAASPVQSIEVLNPQAISIRYDDNGNKFYDYNGYGKPVSLKAWQVQHLKLMEVFGTEYGLGPIQAAASELRGALDLRDYSATWFTEGAVPSGVLSSKDYIDSTTADEYRRRWEEKQAKRGVAVLGNGMAYEPTILAPEDAQFIQNQSFTITQVARLFGIPANYLLAEINGNAMTYQNMEQVDTAFVKYTLTGYLREIEEAFSDLLPRGQKARFKLEGFLRADDRTRAEVHKTYKEMNVLTAEEIRLSEGWGPLPDELKNAPAGAEGE